jgi:hypothetical protein
MHEIEPFYSWQHLYDASEDEHSPYYGKDYSEFVFSNAIYDHFIHPLWDEMGSATLYLKILFVNYHAGFCVIELIGEWNDMLYNDIMYFKRNIAESLMENMVNKFILIGENVLNFHAGDNDYYEEWFDEVGDGWIVGLNFRKHVLEEFRHANLDYYISFGGKFDNFNWRCHDPNQLFRAIDAQIMKRLNPPAL